MYLLALSAFRHYLVVEHRGVNVPSQCTFWCSVLSDLELSTRRDRPFNKSQCTFWRSVLSDVLTGRYPTLWVPDGLNAPSGAQCFPTGQWRLSLDCYTWSQCTFWCSVLSDVRPRRHQPRRGRGVSMHLLVLSAFRRRNTLTDMRVTALSLNAPSGAQCFPTKHARA